MGPASGWTCLGLGFEVLCQAQPQVIEGASQLDRLDFMATTCSLSRNQRAGEPPPGSNFRPWSPCRGRETRPPRDRTLASGRSRVDSLHPRPSSRTPCFPGTAEGAVLPPQRCPSGPGSCGSREGAAALRRSLPFAMGSHQAACVEPGQLPDNDSPQEVSGASRRFTRDQVFALIGAASINFSSMICYSILGPFFPSEAKKKGASDTEVGLIFGCFALFNFLTSLIMGNYLVQIGAKFMFVAGMLVSGCATILFGILDRAPDGPIFIGLCFLVRAVDAVGFAASMTASFSILAKAFPNNIATVLGSLEIFTGLGLVLGPPIGGFLYQTYGYEVPFIALGCVVLVMVPLNIFLLPKYDSAPSKDSFWKLIAIPKIILLCSVMFSLSSCLGFLDPTLSLFVLKKFHLQVGYVGLVFLGLALSYSLSSPLLGFLSDKKPRSRKWLLVIGGLMTALCYFMLGPAPILHIESELWLFVLMLVLDGFCLAMNGIPVFPEVLNCAYENGFEEGLSLLGLISGLFSATWSLGSFVGPTLGGFLNEKFGFEWASAIQGGCALLSGLSIGIYYIYESYCKKRSCPKNLLVTEQERTHLLSSEA